MKKTILALLVLVLCMVAEIAKADFTFGTPTEVPNVNSSANELYTSISSDGLSLFLISTRPGGLGGTDIWVSTRETTDENWSTPVNLGPTINSPVGDGAVSISSDGLSLYFSSTRSRGYGSGDLWVTRRDTIHSEWGSPENLGPTVNSSADQCYVSISADELSLYFSSNRSDGYGAYDLWVTRRDTIHSEWGTPENLGPTVNSSGYDTDPSISANGLLLFFQSTRPGGLGGDSDIWMTRRATVSDPWGEPENLGSVINSSVSDDFPNVSSDGSTLFFRHSHSGRYNGGDIWQAPIIPIVDFNADGIVDSSDMFIMVDHWGEDNQLCDIGPMPWGDGIVDVRDLLVLAEYMSPVPVAHWKLDEIEGVYAIDSAGNNDAIVLGGIEWQPNGGQINGAIKLDGVNGSATAGAVLNPADGPFSIFAWVKGGAPGQVIVSQQITTNWLALEADGKLMTELKDLDGLAEPLISETIITDGQWHRIGLVWDGSHRILYVDGNAVAEDTLVGLESSQMGLYIGVDKNYTPGTFFAGLIDDARIYNVALSTEQIEGLAQ